MSLSRKIGSIALMAVIVLGASALLMPTAHAKKGGGKPTPCNCPTTIEFKDGTVCTLIGGCNDFDCLYLCPLPF